MVVFSNFNDDSGYGETIVVATCFKDERHSLGFNIFLWISKTLYIVVAWITYPILKILMTWLYIVVLVDAI